MTRIHSSPSAARATAARHVELPKPPPAQAANHYYRDAGHFPGTSSALGAASFTPSVNLARADQSKLKSAVATLMDPKFKLADVRLAVEKVLGRPLTDAELKKVQTQLGTLGDFGKACLNPADFDKLGAAQKAAVVAAWIGAASAATGLAITAAGLALTPATAATSNIIDMFGLPFLTVGLTTAAAGAGIWALDAKLYSDGAYAALRPIAPELEDGLDGPSRPRK